MSGQSLLIRGIIKTVETETGITRKEIRSRRRAKQIVRARHLLMYLLHSHTDMSYPEIGKFVGGRDHTSVMYAVKKTQELVRRGDIKIPEIADIKDIFYERDNFEAAIDNAMNEFKMALCHRLERDPIDTLVRIAQELKR